MFRLLIFLEQLIVRLSGFILLFLRRFGACAEFLPFLADYWAQPLNNVPLLLLLLKLPVGFACAIILLVVVNCLGPNRPELPPVVIKPRVMKGFLLGEGLRIFLLPIALFFESQFFSLPFS